MNSFRSSSDTCRWTFEYDGKDGSKEKISFYGTDPYISFHMNWGVKENNMNYMIATLLSRPCHYVRKGKSSHYATDLNLKFIGLFSLKTDKPLDILVRVANNYVPKQTVEALKVKPKAKQTPNVDPPFDYITESLLNEINVRCKLVPHDVRHNEGLIHLFEAARKIEMNQEDFDYIEEICEQRLEWSETHQMYVQKGYWR